MTAEFPDYSREALQAAQEECAREPIHIPGAVQSFGVLLSFDSAVRPG